MRRAPALALAALLAGGCRFSPAITDPRAADTTATDDLGRSVRFAYPPARVLSLAPNLTEIVWAVGAGERVVGVSPSDDFPPEVAALPRFSTFPLAAEAALALEPDLLLATDQVNEPADAERLQSLGVPTFFFSFARLNDVPRAMRTAGRLLGADGDAPARAFERRVAAVQARVAGARRLGALLLVGDRTPFAFGRDSYASELVRAAGGRPVTDAFAGQAAVPSEEFVLEAAPEVVVVLAGDDYDPARLVEHHPAWASLPAVRDGRVHGLDPDLVSRPGPRLAEGLERLAALLHPDLFPAEAASEQVAP